MFLTYPAEERHHLQQSGAQYVISVTHPIVQNFADETRLGIVLLLSELGELCVCDLCTALDQSQPKISCHLALLRESGLLLDRKQGKWVHYRLSPHIPAWAAKIIDEAWRCEQEKVQAIVRNLARQNCSGDSKNICS